MQETLCTFTPHHSEYHTIHTINFVYETKEQPLSSPKAQAMYKAHYVCTGSGNLHLTDNVIPLSEGDVFFTFPDMPFSIESKSDFKFMYVSFLGTRADKILHQLAITKYNFLFPQCKELDPVWKKALIINSEISDLIAESILLYTFAHIGTITLPKESNKEHKVNVSFLVKKYIDENFSNPKLSLEVIGRDISYSPKYLSSVFKKTFNVGIAEYINTVRIQHACMLIRQGVTAVAELSNRCGFSDFHYFSKMFKNQLGVSPSVYVKNI